MGQNASNYDLDDAHHRARPSPYNPPADDRDRNETADLRLAQLAAIPLRSIQHLSPELRDELLEHPTYEQAARCSAERKALAERLSNLYVGSRRHEDREVPSPHRRGT